MKIIDDANYFEWNRKTKTLVVYKIHKSKQDERDPRCRTSDMEVIGKFEDVKSAMIMKEGQGMGNGFPVQKTNTKKG
tara:strand:+ start:182 stop:412 length:231 start_codon:yes stop_codon:yes gene_type:complete